MSQLETLTSEHPATGLNRNSRPWLVGIAAVAVGVVVAGTVGYSMGQGSDPSEGAAAAMRLSSGSPDGVNEGRPGMMGAPEPAVAGDVRMGIDMMPFGYGRIVFAAAGLSTDPDSSAAWAYDPNQVFSKQTAADAATVLGLEGQPTLVDGSWMVGARDGSGPVMWLMPDGMASLSFYDPSMDIYACGADVAEGSGSSVDSSGASVGSGGSADPGTPSRPDCGPSGPDAPQGNTAIGRVKELLSELGVDASGYEFEAADYGTPKAAYVTAFQVVEGQRTGATWSVGFVGRSIQSVNGGLAPLVSLGSYDVVSPTTAVDRLSDPRYGFGSFGGPMPYEAKSPVASLGMMEQGTDIVGPGPDTAVAPQPSLPPTVAPGSSFSWPVQEVTIVKARLGGAMYTQPDGSTVLLPTYELSDSDGQTWSVVAVDDKSMDFTE